MLWQHKYLHFNHGIRVNESSEGVSHCEEVTLEGRHDVNQEETMTCSVAQVSAGV